MKRKKSTTNHPPFTEKKGRRQLLEPTLLPKKWQDRLIDQEQLYVGRSLLLKPDHLASELVHKTERGLKTKLTIRRNALVGLYSGITRDQAAKANEDLLNHDYVYELPNNKEIDAWNPGIMNKSIADLNKLANIKWAGAGYLPHYGTIPSLMAFINMPPYDLRTQQFQRHNINTHSVKITLTNGQNAVGIVTKKEIKAGTELFIDYGETYSRKIKEQIDNSINSSFHYQTGQVLRATPYYLSQQQPKLEDWNGLFIIDSRQSNNVQVSWIHPPTHTVSSLPIHYPLQLNKKHFCISTRLDDYQRFGRIIALPTVLNPSKKYRISSLTNQPIIINNQAYLGYGHITNINPLRIQWQHQNEGSLPANWELHHLKKTTFKLMTPENNTLKVHPNKIEMGLTLFKRSNQFGIKISLNEKKELRFCIAPTNPVFLQGFRILSINNTRIEPLTLTPLTLKKTLERLFNEHNALRLNVSLQCDTTQWLTQLSKEKIELSYRDLQSEAKRLLSLLAKSPLPSSNANSPEHRIERTNALPDSTPLPLQPASAASRPTVFPQQCQNKTALRITQNRIIQVQLILKRQNTINSYGIIVFEQSNAVITDAASQTPNGKSLQFLEDFRIIEVNTVTPHNAIHCIELLKHTTTAQIVFELHSVNPYLWLKKAAHLGFSLAQKKLEQHQIRPNNALRFFPSPSNSALSSTKKQTSMPQHHK